MTTSPVAEAQLLRSAAGGHADARQSLRQKHHAVKESRWALARRGSIRPISMQGSPCLVRS
jgi:hypothetical protein